MRVSLSRKSWKELSRYPVDLTRVLVKLKKYIKLLILIERYYELDIAMHFPGLRFRAANFLICPH